MSKLNNYISMLQEFDYKKNGKELSIEFLEYMLNLFKSTKAKEWENK